MTSWAWLIVFLYSLSLSACASYGSHDSQSICEMDITSAGNDVVVNLHYLGNFEGAFLYDPGCPDKVLSVIPPVPVTESYLAFSGMVRSTELFSLFEFRIQAAGIFAHDDVSKRVGFVLKQVERAERVQ